MMFIIFVRFATEIDNHESDFVHVMWRAFAQDKVLVKRVTLDGVDTVLRRVGANPDRTNPNYTNGRIIYSFAALKFLLLKALLLFR